MPRWQSVCFKQIFFYFTSSLLCVWIHNLREKEIGDSGLLEAWNAGKKDLEEFNSP